jgi:hypothetical protein
MAPTSGADDGLLAGPRHACGPQFPLVPAGAIADCRSRPVTGVRSSTRPHRPARHPLSSLALPDSINRSLCFAAAADADTPWRRSASAAVRSPATIARIATARPPPVAAVPLDRLTHQHPLISPNLATLPERLTRDIGCSSRHDYPQRLARSEAVSPNERALTPPPTSL